jgi:hypothetical protein
MHQESWQYLNNLAESQMALASAQIVLFGFRINRASYSSRSPLIHSYGYASADDRTDYLALNRLPSEPFMNYPGYVPT